MADGAGKKTNEFVAKDLSRFGRWQFYSFSLLVADQSAIRANSLFFASDTNNQGIYLTIKNAYGLFQINQLSITIL